MRFLSRFFGKAPPPPAATRPSTAKSADVTISRAVEQERGAAAVEQMPFGDALLAIAGDDKSSSQKAAQQKLAKMLDAATLDVARLNSQLANKVAVLSIASQATDAKHLEQAIRTIDDVNFWLRLATDGPSTKLRQLAAEQIEDPVQLRKLLKDARGKDKNVYRILRRKCDLLLGQEKQAAERQAHIVSLCETIERHSYKPFDGAFVATLEHLDTQWRALGAEAPAELAPRVEVAIERAREVISNHVRMIGAEAARVTAIENADPQRAILLDEIRAAIASMYEMPAVDLQPAEQLQRWTDRWKSTARHKSAGPDDAAAFNRLHSAVLRGSQLLMQHGPLSQQLEAIRNAAPDADLTANYQSLRATLAVTSALPEISWPAVVAESAAAIDSWHKLRADKDAAAASALRHVGALLGRTNRAINDGRSGQAAGMRRALAEAIAELPSIPAHMPAYMTGQIEQLDQRLNELQDWKSYAVAPKRTQLIEQMQALIGAPTEPAELADQIKRLQEEWKSLTRGSADQSDEDWQKFHEAAQAAYQPCREYFAEQARIREENLEQRKALVAHLAQFDEGHDWANADWKEVARVLRHARQEWRNYNPTERTATKPVQTQFDALVKGMQDRLDAQYTNNIARKQSLIEQVRRLLGEADTRKAIDDVKRLQLAWKSAGLVPHLEDQRLWEEFRKQCDAVYHRSQEEYSKFAAELDTNKTKALELTAQVESCAALTGSELIAAAARVRQLRADFDTIGELPRSESADLQRNFTRAVERYDNEVVLERGREEQQSWNNLFAASNEVRLLQLATTTQTQAELESQRQSVRSTIDGVQQWPKGGLQAIERKLVAPVSADLAANEASLRNICIRAEILTDTATPAADQSLRRNHQLQSLVKGLGQTTGTARERMHELLFEWIAVGPVPTDVYYDLLERFNSCWLKTGRPRT